MAGDWIKMRSGLHESPKVLAISDELQKPVLHIVGMLWRIWSWADQHSLDGQNLTVSFAALDRMVDCPGIAACLRKIGWIDGRPEGPLSFPRFAEHNGQTAKQRALDQSRRRTERGLSGFCPDSSRTETGPEKRREEKRRTSLNPGCEVEQAFEAFWLAYPRKVAKPKAMASFLKVGGKDLLGAMVAALEAQKASPQWQKDNGEYIPHPTTWLNQRRWEDQVAPQKPKFGDDPC
jgi:hypothetical protein